MGDELEELECSKYPVTVPFSAPLLACPPLRSVRPLSWVAVPRTSPSPVTLPTALGRTRTAPTPQSTTISVQPAFRARLRTDCGRTLSVSPTPLPPITASARLPTAIGRSGNVRTPRPRSGLEQAPLRSGALLLSRD